MARTADFATESNALEEYDSQWPPPEDLAAILNALVILLIPLLLLVAFFVHQATDMDAPVRPSGNHFFSDLPGALMIFVPFAPLAVITGSRTRTHVRAYLAGTENRWRGVLEGAALGAVIPLALLIRPALERPQQAAPYLIAYGGIGLTIGLTLGLILTGTALLALKIVARRRTRGT